MSPEVKLPAGPHVSGGEAASASSETAFLFTARTYPVFISYSHVDAQWARWLVRRLENFRVPERFHGRKAPIGTVGARLAPVFRDRDELPTTSDLGETIRSALRQSATLVVICSPNSAKSRWVQEEILAFKRMGGSTRVFAFIVGGEPKAAGTDEDCFSPALRSTLAPDGTISTTPAEHVAADARPQGDGKENAFVRLVAGLLGVGFDELRQREQQRRQRRLLWITAGSVAGMAIALGLAAVAWQARNDARRRQEQAEDVLAFMVGDFRTELKKVGRLTLLDAVGDKATAYFDSLDPRDLTDTALARQSKALYQIGENRMDEARYPEAARAYLAAYARAAALAARHPADGGMLFERGQAEFGIGFVNWKHRNLTAAAEWLARYRDTSLALVALDPAHTAWLKEVAYAHHNFATLEVDRRRFSEAQAGFLAARKAWENLLVAAPKDAELRFNLSEAESWLGNVAERRGELPEATARYRAQGRQLEALVAAEPKTARWRFKLAEGLVLQAGVLVATGQSAAARQLLHDAAGVANALAAQDSANRRWLRLTAVVRLQDASLLREAVDDAGAVQAAAEARAAFEQLAATQPKEWSYLLGLTMAHSFGAELVPAASRGEAMAKAEKAVQLGEALVQANAEDDVALGAFVQACVVAGTIAAAGPEGGAVARRHWQRAAEVAASRANDSNDWRLLDPMARALASLGRPEESRALVARLTRFGYRPRVPWPEAVRN